MSRIEIQSISLGCPGCMAVYHQTYDVDSDPAVTDKNMQHAYNLAEMKIKNCAHVEDELV